MSNQDQLLPSSADEVYTTFNVVQRLLFEQGLVHWRKYLFAFSLMGIAAGATAFSAYLVGRVINEAYVARSFPGVLSVGLFIMVVLTVKGLATYGQAVMMTRIGNRVVALNQRRIFRKLLSENLGYFANRHTSEFVTRLNTGATAATSVLNTLIQAVGRDFLSLVGLVVVMVVQDPIMSLFSLVVAPPALVILRKLIRRTYKIARNQFHGGMQTVETFQETLQGLRTVKAFTMEDAMRERFDRNVDMVEKEANNMARVGFRASPLMETLGGLAVALAVIYGGWRVIMEGATPGQFVSFLTAFLLAYEPAKRLARLNIELSGGLVGVRALFEVIDTPPTEPDDSTKPEIQFGPGRVEFSDVGFAYRADEPVLSGMSFITEPGKLTAFVGPSGGGKSTIFNLLMRFYDAQRGTIAVDGQDIQKFSRKSLRSEIAYVGQDVFLFRGSIYDNIAFGKPGATREEIVAAAKGAYAHDFITAFPNGYETPVGEHGMQLSGGQRQRIAIARALVRNAPIILLDEATAALDSESELAVREAMEHLCEGRTTLAIAHRLHTVSHADRILVIEGGKVVETGRHEELLRKAGRYAAFYRLQLVNSDEPSAATTRSATG